MAQAMRTAWNSFSLAADTDTGTSTHIGDTGGVGYGKLCWYA